MKGSEGRLVEFMDGAKKRFVIPVYQRNYDWKIENCTQLYDDLVKVIKEDKRSHFFGSLVFVNSPDGRYTKSLIIDGQQRLTTVSLLFLAMYNRLKEGSVIPKYEPMQTEIYETYLVDKFQQDETRIKLKPVKNDQLAFKKFFESDPSAYDKESNLTENYQYFYERLGGMDEEGITIDSLYDAICRLEIISIALSNDDNAQLIFESLNSTGLALQEGDKIRNFMLMDLSEKDQEFYYENYWNKIETCTNYDVSSFVRDYLSIKQGSIPSMTKVYNKFKEYVNDGKKRIPDILEELLAYAKRYKILLEGGTENKNLNSCIYRLNRLETSTTRPFFLEVLRLYDTEILGLNEVAEIFRTTESYLFRRIICDLPTSALNKIFLLLHNEIIRYENNTDKYLDKFKYALLTKKDRGRFPGDEEFIDAFTKKSVYLMLPKNRIYILERLENFGAGREDKDIYNHYDEGEYSIEHVMPQHLTPVWQKELGKDYAKIHEAWLHRIANLTLTAYNSSYSNKPFDVKKTCEHGFKASGIRLNTYITEFEKWDEEALKIRDKHLKEEALRIWEMPVTRFKPDVPELDCHALDEDENLLTGRTIVGFALKNKDYKTDSWADMLQQVIQLLFVEHRSIIRQLATRKGGFLPSQFTKLPEGEKGYREIGSGVYILTSNNTSKKLRILNKLFKKCEESPSDLLFYLRNDDDDGDESAE